ncbi:hypothetical protein KOR42_24300 [Thalassoglobus neptunius]|uniref:Uncharacterized protein n=1 Tax=Thalassoglobus neptunius TaxID=1938619 RepID=A0A5C5X9H3_9PLAN|nr:hypothetical protein KOR42_24300 [Thalassoglobus neptunius]
MKGWLARIAATLLITMNRSMSPMRGREFDLSPMILAEAQEIFSERLYNSRSFSLFSEFRIIQDSSNG